MALISADDIKVEIHSIADDDTSWDALLGVLAIAVERIFGIITGRVWEQAEFTEFQNSYNFQSVINLKNYPIASIASFHDDPDWSYGSDTLIPATDYTFNAEDGSLFYAGQLAAAKNNLKIVYTAGYTVANFDEGIKQIWTRQAAQWYLDPKGKSWSLVTQTQPGGNISRRELEDGLLPEFNLMAQLQGSING